MLQTVAEFHRVFGLPIATSPGLPDPDQRALRRRLLDEEVQEYLDAEAATDIVEVADALADIQYIILGTMVVYGLEPDPASLETDYPPMGHPSFLASGLRTQMCTNIATGHAAYEAGETQDDLPKIHAALNALLKDLQIIATYYAIPLDRVFAEVHASNMSKLDALGQPIYRDDGKILKGPLFRKPDISGVLFGRAA